MQLLPPSGVTHGGHHLRFHEVAYRFPKLVAPAISPQGVAAAAMHTVWRLIGFRGLSPAKRGYPYPTAIAGAV
jgi:hypothetical protein